jgi:hypothetical protein
VSNIFLRVNALFLRSSITILLELSMYWLFKLVWYDFSRIIPPTLKFERPRSKVVLNSSLCLVLVPYCVLEWTVTFSIHFNNFYNLGKLAEIFRHWKFSAPVLYIGPSLILRHLSLLVPVPVIRGPSPETQIITI